MKTPDQSQQAAIDTITRGTKRAYMLIGAGGSGKTFTIQHILARLWADSGNAITNESTFLAAPTGKASKVINDAFALDGFFVENQAKTIHRLLHYIPGKGFTYNEENLLPASLIIIDEASMVDSQLMAALLRALPKGCFVILVGDENQLPPVGPGQPFTDLITCGSGEMVNRLTTNHRQQQGSLIAHGCLSILAGVMPTFGQPGQNTLNGELQDDLFFHPCDDKEDIADMVADICAPWHQAGLDYAALTPQNKGPAGVSAMNELLQARLNPPAAEKPELRVASWLTFRLGDRVLQTKNNYDLGVFNGFCGTIEQIQDDSLLVSFDDEVVLYEKPEHIKQLILGYAMTIHKSQGSQWQYGCLVCHTTHFFMLQRSILYTGVSRFRKELHIIGETRAIKQALKNQVSGERQTYLKLRLAGEVV